MGNACSTGSSDRKGSDAYNPTGGIQNKNEPTKKKSSWKKGSRSKDKGEKSGEASDAKLEGSQEQSDSSGTKMMDQEEYHKQQQQQQSHSKLESKVSEDISTSSMPIAQHQASNVTQSEHDAILSKFTENTRSIITGRVPSDTAVFPKSKQIILYVCADYNEFVTEQTILRNKVYSQLREKYSKKGYELCLVDLHYCLESEYLDDHSFMETCIMQMKPDNSSCFIVPIVFIKEKNGYDMIPCEMAEVHFENVLNCANEGEKSVLNTWYYVERHLAKPVYKLRHITSCLPKFSSSNADERSQAFTDFKQVIEQLKLIIWKYSTTEMKLLYFKTGLQQEIEAINDNIELEKNCIMFSQFKSEQTLNDESPESAAQSKTVSLFECMKKKLNASRVFNLNNLLANGVKSFDDCRYKEECQKQLSSTISSVVDALILENHDKITKFSDLKTILSSELIEQSKACLKKAEQFQNMNEALEKLQSYIENDVKEPLIVHGPSGSGKSCLLAKAAQMCNEWLPKASVIFRIVGISLDSSTEERICMSICQQCAHLCQPDNQLLRPMTFVERSEVLPQLFSEVCSTRPLVVIIDGIDQISAFSSSSLSWLPYELRANIKVILSLSDGSEQFTKVKEIIQNEESFYAMPKLCADDAISLFDRMCEPDYKLVEEQHNFIRETLNNCSLPYFIHLLASSASDFTSEISNEDLNIGHDIKSQIDCELNTIERKYGKIRVSFALGFITAAKYGLSDSEIQDVLYMNEDKIKEEMKDFEITHEVSPVLLWTQLKRNLKSLIVTFKCNNVMVNCWRSCEVQEIIRSRYLEENNPRTKHMRTVLVDYLKNSCSKADAGKRMQFIAERAFCELPYQSSFIADSMISDYIFNLDWLSEKLAVCDTYQVLEDVVLCLTQSNSDQDCQELNMIKDFLELSYEALSWNVSEITSQLYGRLTKFFDSPNNVDTYPRMKSLYNYCKSSAAPTLLPLNEAVQGIKRTADLGEGDEACINYCSFYKICNHPRLIISLSPADGIIIVWDVYTQTALRTLKGIATPRNLQMIDDFNAIVLCYRELKIYNLDEGTLKTNIKGVMNQNMPYFGLNDEEHVVALSRNRMYVNVLSTNTGDLVTTFKVGEDRFLNSLIVSKNGKICVCGDQTQKPSPLLVWDLTSRKLMYDLRIPHHEFQTKYAAITDDGNYVVCVSKEIDNETPSNVVVYDLQSGTLFKKWKPGANTCSIAISSNGNCVITALEDNTIAVWDLVTGALRATLIGHTAPVSDISLSDVGTNFLTYDNTNRDRTIRLWDSSSGKAIATFTPDYPIVTCQISSEGDMVILGLEGVRNIVTLVLCRDSSTFEKIHLEKNKSCSYGNELYHCKTFEIE